jgi:hypothetical protein
VDDVDAQLADQADETCDRDGPTGGVAGPLPGAVARRQALHRDRVKAGAGGCELVRQRRGTRQRDVAVELVGWKAAQHPHE